ncbi:putative oxidoreductase dhs-27 [Orchesella cincta]|uniref:Putative oxidoreductase dhs-27 n=1 Tax=Orchesella cincta TaxID=48709 RepID=A0A1D2NAW2_ORCCI|nr:putative oxidoreductase dhs-27 [Orchesella cincta]
MPPIPKDKDFETSDEVTRKYKEILLSNGVTDEISEVIVKSAGLKGEGFASVSKYVTIKFQNPSVKPLNLFVKAHSSNAAHTEMLTEAKLFEKESRFYMEYIPAAKEFCKSKGCEGLVDMFPKCYYGDEHMIVFENLVVEKGYELLDKKELQDLEAIRFAIINLAKHHAISYALIQEMGGPENFFKRFPNLDFEVYTQPTARTMMDPMIENAIDTNLKILQKNKSVPDSDELIAFLNAHVGKAYDQILDLIKCRPEQEKLLVLGHGDYWTNNMMFLKNKETNQIIGHMAIDLQVTRYNSPGLDLSQYFFTSVRPEVRRNHLYEILGRYFDTLKSTALKLGHPIDLTFEELHTIYRRKMKLGFWFAISVATGAGFDAFKDIDVNEIGELKNFSIEMDKAVQKWMVANPGKVVESISVLRDLVNEYKMLSIE